MTNLAVTDGSDVAFLVTVGQYRPEPPWEQTRSPTRCMTIALGFVEPGRANARGGERETRMNAWPDPAAPVQRITGSGDGDPLGCLPIVRP